MRHIFMNYKKNKKQKYPNPFKKKIGNGKNRKIFIILFVILAVAGCYFLFFTELFNIKLIRVRGDYPVAPEQAVKLTNVFLNQNIIFPKRFFFFFNTEAFAKEFENYYALDSIKIQKKFKTRSVDIFLNQRAPVGYLISRGLVFKIDKNGRIIEYVKTVVDKDKYFRIYDAENNLPPDGIEKEAMDFIFNFYNYPLGEIFEPLYWQFFQDKNQLTLKTDKNYFIYFNYKANLESQLQTLNKFFQYIVTEENMSKIDYIDLRFDERIYYKFK